MNISKNKKIQLYDTTIIEAELLYRSGDLISFSLKDPFEQSREYCLIKQYNNIDTNIMMFIHIESNEGDIVQGKVIRESSGSKNRICNRYLYETEVLIIAENSEETIGMIKDVSNFGLKLECDEIRLDINKCIEIFFIDHDITLNCLIIREAEENSKRIYGVTVIYDNLDEIKQWQELVYKQRVKQLRLNTLLSR